MSEALDEPGSEVLLIDLENCPNQINLLLKDLERFSQVVICYAQSGAKIPLDWLLPLTATVNAQRLKIFKMPNGGKNAADFGISFFAGALMQELPPDTRFVIMSEDTDLDHVVGLLKSQGRPAIRINTKKDEKKTATTTLHQDVLHGFCKNLVLHHKNRPTRKETLLNSLKAPCQQDMAMAQEIFRLLAVSNCILIQADDSITYNDKKIMELAK